MNALRAVGYPSWAMVVFKVQGKKYAIAVEEEMVLVWKLLLNATKLAWQDVL